MKAKNLEIEYRNLVVEDIPDLWDRIEGALQDRQVIKETTTVNANNQAVASEKSQATTEQIAEAKKSQQAKAKRRNRFIIYVPVIAAAAVVFIVAIPVAIAMTGIGLMGTKKSADFATEAPMAAYDYDSDSLYESEAVMEEAVCDEPAEAEEDFFDSKEEMKGNDFSGTTNNSDTVMGIKPFAPENGGDAATGGNAGAAAETADPTAPENFENAEAPIVQAEDAELIESIFMVENERLVIDSLTEVDGKLVAVGTYKATSPGITDGYGVEAGRNFTAVVSENSAETPVEGEGYKADVYMHRYSDGSVIYEIVIKSRWR